MSAVSNNNMSAEDEILKQIAATDRQIFELRKEQDSLIRILRKIRDHKLTEVGVTRKNSINRIMVEKAVVDKLCNSKDALGTKVLYRAAASMVPTLNYGSFRSNLTRMNGRQIEPSGHGKWRLKTAAPLLNSSS